MAYEWISDLQGSLFIGLSGYFLATGYSINLITGSNNLNMYIGFPDDFTKITGRTITIDPLETPQMVTPNQLGSSGWEYGFQIEYSIFTKTDRDVEVLLYEITNHLKDIASYYDWGIAVTGGLAAGTTSNYIVFDGIVARRIRSNQLETNIFLNHRGSVRTQASFCSDDLL